MNHESSPRHITHLLSVSQHKKGTGRMAECASPTPCWHTDKSVSSLNLSLLILKASSRNQTLLTPCNSRTQNEAVKSIKTFKCWRSNLILSVPVQKSRVSTKVASSHIHHSVTRTSVILEDSRLARTSVCSSQEKIRAWTWESFYARHPPAS